MSLDGSMMMTPKSDEHTIAKPLPTTLVSQLHFNACNVRSGLHRLRNTTKSGNFTPSSMMNAADSHRAWRTNRQVIYSSTNCDLADITSGNSWETQNYRW